MYFTVIYRRCSKCDPWRCKQICTRRAKLSMTRLHMSLGIACASDAIACFRSSMVSGLFWYTLSLRYPHRKKSRGFKSGEYADHSGSHLRLINRPPNLCWSHAKDSSEVWGVAPSCWNHWRALKNLLCWPSSAQNLCSTSTYRALLIVTACPSSFSNQ